MAFIKNNTKKGWRKDNDKRVELPDYPERALEEGLVNTLIHRSYLQTGAHSQVDIYDDRIVITNPGGMFDGSEVQLLDIRHVPSKLRNPILADVFGRMRLMERRGSGFKKILDAYEAEERYKEELKPVFYTDGYNFFLTLWNLNYAHDKAQNKAQNKAQKNMMSDREHLLLLLKENPSLTQGNCYSNSVPLCFFGTTGFLGCSAVSFFNSDSLPKMLSLAFSSPHLIYRDDPGDIL